MSTAITPEERGVWRLRTTITKQAIATPDDRLFIPSFDTGKSYRSEYLAVGVKVSNSKSNWRNGGYLSQEFRFPISGYTNNNKAFNRTEDLLIDDVTIIKVPLLAQGEYSLRYFPPTYFTDVRLQIWEYSGVQVDLLLADLADFFRNAPADLLINLPLIEEKLDLLLANQQSWLSVDLSSIESKIDALALCLNCEINSPGEEQIDRYTFVKLFNLF